MAAPIAPQQLLDQAWAIALIEEPEADRMGADLAEILKSTREGVRAPLTAADYRRAISSAYYALFHAITLASASLFAPSPETRNELVRWFNHRDIKAVTAWVGGKAPDGLERSVAELYGDERVRTVCDAFQRLVTAREDADYNHTVTFSQSDVRDLVRVAQHAVDLVTKPEPSRAQDHYRQQGVGGGATALPDSGRYMLAASPAGRLFLGLIALRARGGGG